MLRVLVLSVLLTSCGVFHGEPDSGPGSGDATSPLLDSGSPGDSATGDATASPDALVTCETVTWEADLLGPPDGVLVPLVDRFGVVHPVTSNFAGGIGIDSDGLVSASEGLVIQFTREVRLVSYDVRGGRHQLQVRLSPVAQNLTLQSDVDGTVTIDRDVSWIQLNGLELVALERLSYVVCSDSRPVDPPPMCREHVQSFQNDYSTPPLLTLDDSLTQDLFRRGIGPVPTGRLSDGKSMTLSWTTPTRVVGYNHIVRDSDGVENFTHEYVAVLANGETRRGDVDSSSTFQLLDLPDVISLTLVGRSTDQIVMSGVSYVVCEDAL